MMIKELSGPGDEAIVAEALRRRIVGALRWASALFARMARRVAGRSQARQPHLEFYAEAGAPEGALYLDGQHAGNLPGVTRL